MIHPTSTTLFSLVFSSLSSFRLQNLTIFRLDAELALQTGYPPLFCSDILDPTRDVFGRPSSLETQPASITTRPLHMMMTMMNFASLLNSNERDSATRLDPLIYTETIVWLLYRLIEISPLDQHCSASGNVYDQLACFTMLAFMTTLLPEYGRDDTSYPLLSRKLENTIQNLNITSVYTQHSELTLLLWSLLVSGISVLKSTDYRWLIMEICKRLDLHDWLAVRRQLCRFPWILTVHDISGHGLWNDAHQWSTRS